ncbi:hypothetical protein [Streptomyces mirabilis]|uniref:hypothetical protein n=1 Tax=Streptomyces mirabilis TaxID=68239 RepID=UPI0036DBED44
MTAHRRGQRRGAPPGGKRITAVRAYRARLAETLLTPAERAERAAKALVALTEWNGYAPTAAEERDLDSELDRRLARASGQ